VRIDAQFGISLGMFGITSGDVTQQSSSSALKLLYAIWVIC
jgi:hypothetical protein